MTISRWSSVRLHELPAWLQIEQGALHLWSVPLDPPEPLIRQLGTPLSEKERNIARCFVRVQDQRRYVVAHAVLRILLARYAGIEAHALRFITGPQGKPALAGSSAISFNMSHSGELAIIGISNFRLGVDIEQLRHIDHSATIAQSFFSPAEVAALAPAPAANADEDFLICWTRKEAFLKAVGGGLSIGLDRFEVSVSRDRPAILRIDDAALSARPWTMIHLEPADHYLGATVIEGKVQRVQSLHF